MFGLGMPEILLILAIALIVIGPKKLPELAKTLGRAMGEFKRSAQDFKRSIDIETTVRDSAKDITPPSTKDLKDIVKDVNKEAAQESGAATEDNGAPYRPAEGAPGAADAGKADTDDTPPVTETPPAPDASPKK